METGQGQRLKKRGGRYRNRAGGKDRRGKGQGGKIPVPRGEGGLSETIQETEAEVGTETETETDGKGAVAGTTVTEQWDKDRCRDLD